VLLARLAHPPLAECLIFAALAAATALFAFLKKHARATLLVAAAFVCAGAALASADEWRESATARLRSLYERGAVLPGEPVELTGVLERAPEITPDGLLLPLRVEVLRYKADERACSGRVELFAPVRDARAARAYEALELRCGARVRVMTMLARAERFRNPGVESLGEFLERRDLDARGTIKSPLLVERLDDERVLLPLFWLDEWRAGLVRRIDAAFSRDAAGVLKAALLGNRYGLTRETAERFRDGGTFHILVISGLHITFIGALVWAAARRFTRRRFWQWAASAAFVWAYAVGVGAGVSVVRAALMFTGAAGAVALGRRAGPLNASGGAALALLVIRPASLFDPSFQLTFLSVGSIVAIAAPLLANLQAVGSWRPTRATPYPPACPRWFRALGEALYWRERAWRRELEHATHSYHLFKTPWATRLERWRVQRLLRFAFAAVLVSVVVQLTLLPLLVVYFHRLSLASPLMNVFVGALMVALAFSALAALALSFLSGALAAPLARLAEAAAALMIHSVDPLARAHVASLRLPEYSGAASAVYFLYFLPLVVLTCALLRWRPLAAPPRSKVEDDRRVGVVDEERMRLSEERLAGGDGEGAARTLLGLTKKRLLPGSTEGGRLLDSTKGEHLLDLSKGQRLLKLAAFAFAGLAFVIIAHPSSAGRADGRLRVDFLDVGQGDSALVTMPDGATLLIDGGGRPDLRRRRGVEDAGAEFEPDAREIGDAVVSEYLWWRGLSRIDYMLATHADADHIDGLNAVVKNFKVAAAFVARAPTNNPEFVRFDASAHAAGVPLYVVGRGDRLRFGAVTVDVLWPPLAAGDADVPSDNNDSIVLRLSFGRRTFLLTGDAEADAERALVSAGDPLRCDALKVAHHGSRTSSTEAFVSAARPALAVVSVGQDSPYGHPHAEVLARWRAAGALVLTTGERGTVTVSTDGEDLRAETFVKQ
jgi:ComEC/Rec2-related protein